MEMEGKKPWEIGWEIYGHMGPETFFLDVMETYGNIDGARKIDGKPKEN